MFEFYRVPFGLPNDEKKSTAFPPLDWVKLKGGLLRQTPPTFEIQQNNVQEPYIDYKTQKLAKKMTNLCTKLFGGRKLD